MLTVLLFEAGCFWLSASFISHVPKSSLISRTGELLLRADLSSVGKRVPVVEERVAIIS